MGKKKFKQVLLTLVAWIFAVATVYLVYVKAKILLNQK